MLRSNFLPKSPRYGRLRGAAYHNTINIVSHESKHKCTKHCVFPHILLFSDFSVFFRCMTRNLCFLASLNFKSQYISIIQLCERMKLGIASSKPLLFLCVRISNQNSCSASSTVQQEVELELITWFLRGTWIFGKYWNHLKVWAPACWFPWLSQSRCSCGRISSEAPCKEHEISRVLGSCP